jgi:hypothetical protein
MAELNQAFSNAFSSGDIGTCVKVLDQVKAWEDMRDIVTFLEDERKTNNFYAVYLIANIHERYNRWGDAIAAYAEAGKSGLPSGFYIAARIIEERSAELTDGNEYNYSQLIRDGVKGGHLWSKMAVLREDSSLLGKARFYFFRFIAGPIQLLRSVTIKKERDRIRY